MMAVSYDPYASVHPRWGASAASPSRVAARQEEELLKWQMLKMVR